MRRTPLLPCLVVFGLLACGGEDQGSDTGGNGETVEVARGDGTVELAGIADVVQVPPDGGGRELIEDSVPGEVAADVLVRVDPATGAVLEEVGPMNPYSDVFGLAGDSYNAYAFDDSGAILQLDIQTGAATVVLEPFQGASWWGAGVTTRYVGE